MKFPNSPDGSDTGAIEYLYTLMAKEAGILIRDHHLFPSKKEAGYFAVKRFNAPKNKRLHMHVTTGLIHSDFRMPAFDYENLLYNACTHQRCPRGLENVLFGCFLMF